MLIRWQKFMYAVQMQRRISSIRTNLSSHFSRLNKMKCTCQKAIQIYKIWVLFALNVEERKYFPSLEHSSRDEYSLGHRDSGNAFHNGRMRNLISWPLQWPMPENVFAISHGAVCCKNSLTDKQKNLHVQISHMNINLNLD